MTITISELHLGMLFGFTITATVVFVTQAVRATITKVRDRLSNNHYQAPTQDTTYEW